MTRDNVANLKLSSINLHLKSIFDSEAYLELGNIDYESLERVLNYEMVDISDIVSFNIQNIGIGKMDVQDKELNNKLPYLFFKNIVDKDKLKQLFISYGILKYINSDNKETFMTMVLLPVDLFFSSGNIYFQLIGQPLENPLLSSTLTEITRSNVQWGNRLDSVYALDQFCMSFARNEGFSISLENYLTYGNVRKKDVLIDFSKLEINKETEEDLADKLYTANISDLYYSLPLSKVQRETLINSVLGKSFSIIGRLGVGKTTVLKDIMINAINQEKRVLFISDMPSTLSDVLATIKSKNMGNYIADLSAPFASLINSSIDVSLRSYVSISEIKADLLARYHQVKEYEMAMNGRIADFRFNEILDELIKFPTLPQEKIEIDKLDDLYKHEYFEIKENIEKIKTALLKIDNFKESIWKEIPVLNNIKYPNQIITLIYQIDRCFRSFFEEKTFLETNFGVNKIENYAMLKNVLYYLENLDIALIPESWVEETLKVFKEAQAEYKNLKNEIYKLQEIKYSINHRFTNLETISIDDEIAIIFKDYFNESQLEKIDSLNADRKNVTIKINKGAIQKEIYLKTSESIFDFSNWEFWKTDEGLKEIIKFTNYISTHKINRKFVNIIVNNQYDSFAGKIDKLEKEIDFVKKEIDDFQTKVSKLTTKECFTILKSINDAKNIESIPAKNKALRGIKKKYNNIKIEELVAKIEKYIENNHQLNVLKEQYFNLTKIKYDINNNLTESLDDLREYFDNIERYEYRGFITKMLYKLTEKEVLDKEEYDRIVKMLLMYKKSYLELSNLIDDFSRYNLLVPGNTVYEKISNLGNVFAYIQNLYFSNDRMLFVKRTKDQDYIKAETYLSIRDSLLEKNKHINSLQENEKYKNLYGQLYNNADTDVKLIAKVLQNFETYISCFTNTSCFIKSVAPERNRLIKEHIAACKEIGNTLTEIFKMYCKIFKDGISRYYYHDFEETIEYTTKLLNSKEELLSYLAITEGISTLNKYKLGKLIKHVITTKQKDNLVNDFCSIYLNGVRNKYLAANKILIEIDDINNYLYKIGQLEAQLINSESENILNDIRKNSLHRVNLNNIEHLDYQSYVNRTKGIKHILLANTKTVDKYLNVDDFDLIIVDDAHIPSSNIKFLSQIKSQVIISGDYQVHESISKNLISIIRNTQRFWFDYRYSLTPKGLMNFMEGQRGLFPNEYSLNIGLEIIEKKVNDYIFELFIKEEDVKINYFVKDLSKQQDAYRDLAKILVKKGYDYLQIQAFLNENINICDLATGYLISADYNIIDYEDYYMVDIDYIYDNMLDNLMLCQKKIIIYDSKKILQEDKNFKFARGLKEILEGREQIFSRNFIEESKEILAQKITEYGYEVFVNNDNMNLVLKKDKILYGVIILFDDINRTEILNIYRDKYFVNIKKGWKIAVFSKIIFEKGLAYVAKRIVEALNSD